MRAAFTSLNGHKVVWVCIMCRTNSCWIDLRLGIENMHAHTITFHMSYKAVSTRRERKINCISEWKFRTRYWKMCAWTLNWSSRLLTNKNIRFVLPIWLTQCVYLILNRYEFLRYQMSSNISAIPLTLQDFEIIITCPNHFFWPSRWSSLHLILTHPCCIY